VKIKLYLEKVYAMNIIILCITASIMIALTAATGIRVFYS